MPEKGPWTRAEKWLFFTFFFVLLSARFRLCFELFWPCRKPFSDFFKFWQKLHKFWTPWLEPPKNNSTPNMTGRRFHRTMEMIPRSPLVILKPLCFHPYIKRSTKQGGARGTSEVWRGTSSNHFHCPISRSSSHIGHGTNAGTNLGFGGVFECCKRGKRARKSRCHEKKIAARQFLPLNPYLVD